MLRPLLLLVPGVLAFTARGAAPAEDPAIAKGPEYTPAWVTRAIPGPRVSHHVFASRYAGGNVSYHLYTPVAHDSDPAARYPVLYWLHGSGGGLPGIPQLARLFDEAIAAGRLPPMFVVFVNGLPNGMYLDWKDGSVRVESMIIRDLIPHIDATHRTLAARSGRLIEGFSMGGYGAARLGFSHPHLFAGVSLLGAGPLQPDFSRTTRAGPARREEIFDRVYGNDPTFFLQVSPWAIAERQVGRLRGMPIRQAVGDRDETFPNNRAFHERMQALGLTHEWTVVPGLGHDPVGMIRALGNDFWTFHRTALAKGAEAGPAAAETPELEMRLKVKGADRRAIVVNAAGGVPRPAVLVLHGGMGSAERMRHDTGFDALARREGFIVAYPEGTAFGEGRHAWNTGHLLRRQVRNADDIAFLDAVIDRLVAEHGANPARIYVTGGSNGGMMTFVYAVQRARRLAAVAPVVASMFTFERAPEVPLPILIINGARDNEVPLEGGMSGNPLVRNAQATPFKPLREVVDFWVRANRSAPAAVTATAGGMTTHTHPAAGDGAVTEWVVDASGGHGWPGRVSRRADNAPIAAFDGAERVWAFFRQHSRPAAR